MRSTRACPFPHSRHRLPITTVTGEGVVRPISSRACATTSAPIPTTARTARARTTRAGRRMARRFVSIDWAAFGALSGFAAHLALQQGEDGHLVSFEVAIRLARHDAHDA